MEIAINPRGNRYKCVGSDLDRSPLALLYKASGAIVPPVCFDNEGKVLVIMVFSSKWRARAISSLALAVALAATSGASVFADYWLGYRANGNLCNRYMVPLNLPQEYSQSLRRSVGRWRFQAPSISAGLQVFVPTVPNGVIPPDMDKCMVETTRTRHIEGISRPYVL